MTAVRAGTEQTTPRGAAVTCIGVEAVDTHCFNRAAATATGTTKKHRDVRRGLRHNSFEAARTT
jgi:hypothetical protein